MVDDLNPNPPPPNPATWFANADPTIVTHMTNRGWDKLPADQAALQAIKAHNEAEKFIGVPANELLRFPKDASDAAGWNTLRAKLGVPSEAKEYDFTTVKRSDKTDLDQPLVDGVRAIAAALYLPKDQAPALAKGVVDLFEARDKAAQAEYAMKLDQDRAALKTNWGAGYNANMIVAQNAFAKLSTGKTPEQIQEAMSALEKSAGYGTVMEMFRQIGTHMGEDTFISNGPGGAGSMSAAQAQQTLDQKTKDPEWVKRYEAGDAVAGQEFDNLTRLIAAAKASR